jgi:hypothetical protein
MTLTPPADPAELPVDGDPVVDVEAYVKGNLIGGIRRVWRPPVPLGQLGELSYAESEIMINPDPPVAGQPATFAAQVRNNSDLTQTIALKFGWANFGFGIPFTTTSVVPTQTVITLSPHMTSTVSAQWTPPYSDHFCVQIILINAQTGEELHSQRNVDAIEVPETQCESFVKEFWLQNATPLTVTVTLGTNAINLPPGWTYSITPTEVVLAPYEGITATVVITPPCELDMPGWISGFTEDGNLSPPTIRVEGYDQNGGLVGGVELQLIAVVQQPIYLPLVLRGSMVTGGHVPSTGVLGLPDRRIENPLWPIFLLMGGVGLYLRRTFNR